MPQSTTLNYLTGDHLGSTSLAVNASTGDVVTTRYREASRRDKPWGEVRYHWVDEDLITDPAYKLPVYTFTGQRSFMDDPSTTAVEGFGLLDYNARMYDPAIGRFVSADSIVAGGVQGYDRYNYVGNSPTVYTDPSGHQRVGSEGGDNVPYCAKDANSHEVQAMQKVKDIELHNMTRNFAPNIKSYATASIGVQNPYSLGRDDVYGLRVVCPWPICESSAYYYGRGLALISDAQMNTPYGDVVKGTGYWWKPITNGVGLGLQGRDQTRPDVALLGMQLRIQFFF